MGYLVVYTTVFGTVMSDSVEKKDIHRFVCDLLNSGVTTDDITILPTDVVRENDKFEEIFKEIKEQNS